jgi:hypothetical protein
MAEFIAHSSWMRDIPDDARVTGLSIPGTHDTCSVDGLLGFGKTQNLDLVDQLNAGIRFLDVRLSHYRDNLFVHHDVVHMGKCYADVLDICTNFLNDHPSEAILMSVKDEERFDSNLGRFAPSEVFGKSRGDRANWAVRSNAFEDAFQARTWQQVDDESLFYNLTIPLPESQATSSALTSQTTLGKSAVRSFCCVDSKVVSTLASTLLIGRKIDTSEVRQVLFMPSKIAIWHLGKTASTSSPYRT